MGFMLDGDDEGIISEWRHTTEWTSVGMGKISLDGRIALCAFFSIPFEWLRMPTVVLALTLVLSWWLKVRPSQLTTFFIRRMRSRRLGGNSMYQRSGLLGVLFCVFVLNVMPLNVYAEFNIVTPPPQPKVDPGVERELQYEHELINSLDDVIPDSFGHDIPLEQAVNLIIPGQFKVSFEDDSGSKKVDWRMSGKTSREILVFLSNQADAKFTVDEDKGVIVFSRLNSGMVMTNEGAVKNNNERQYVLYKGRMLSTELSRWADESGFTFHWGLDNDYVIYADAFFNGTVEKVVREVLATYQEQNGLLDAEIASSGKNDVIAFVKKK